MTRHIPVPQFGPAPVLACLESPTSTDNNSSAHYCTIHHDNKRRACPSSSFFHNAFSHSNNNHPLANPGLAHQEEDHEPHPDILPRP